MSKRMYHPCHKLSVPSAKLFWCRHCMQMFEDAITRWKHSRKCHAIRGFRQKDQDAKVVQLYVKPDTVSYSSNVSPGQAVYHKPHVKKTSTDLKCVICGTKFPSLYDMRRHVKEPCQKLATTVTSSEKQFSDSEDGTESYSSLKIRRVETEDEEKVNTNTALSVLAEASKHVESLSYAAEVKFEQVIEEVPQDIVGITQSGETESNEEFIAGFPWFQLADRAPAQESQQPVQEVVVAYPRPQVRPELGTIVLSLQTEDGKLILQDSIDLETIQDCVKDTALTLPVGQIIHIQLERSEKYLEFVVGYQGIIWPLEEKTSLPASSVQEQTTNTVLSRKTPATLLTTQQTVAPVSSGVEERSYSEGNINQPIVDASSVFSQEIVITSEEIAEYRKAENNSEVTKEGTGEVVQLETSSSGEGFGQTVYQVPIEQSQVVSNSDLPEGSQLVTSLSVGQTVEFRGLQTGTSQTNTESLVEALLKGSVIINPSVVPQQQTQIAVVEVPDQHLNNLTKPGNQLLQSYQYSSQWPVENS